MITVETRPLHSLVSVQTPAAGRSSGSSYFFAHMSQIPNKVGAIQPKLISGSTTRKIVAITSGSGEPTPLLRQKKLPPVRMMSEIAIFRQLTC